jgi:ATP-dependent exoDNAse (exonuclease V) alpha subunit
MSPEHALQVAKGMVRDRRVLTPEGGRMTTLAVRAQEQAIERRAQQLAASGGRDVGERSRTRAISEVAEHLAGPPTPEQTAALRAITGDERLAVLVGPAGTGKGVVIGMAARAEKHAGHHTIGVAVSGSTAERLGETTPALEGRTSTIDALIARADAGTVRIGPNTTVFLDETGMADHRRLDALTQLIEQSGAKLVAVGDGKQLPSIGPGGMFDRLTAHARSAELQDIHRTSDPAERQAWAALRRGEPEKEMAHYQAQGQLFFMDDRQQAGEAAVQRWAEFTKTRDIRSVALIADSSNVEIDRLNARAQHLRAERGELGHRELPLSHQHYGLREGDLITFTAQHHQPGYPRVENGTRAEVTRVGENNNLTLTLDGSGRELQLAGKDLENLRLAYAQHVYRQQGATVDADVDLARARFKISDAKTTKGVREVEMTLWARSELVRHREQRIRDGFPMEPTDHFFGTASGSRRDADRFRDRVLARSTELANVKRAEQGLPALPKITPHSLRRTWAMLAAQAGRDPHWISDQIGHTSAAFTL